MGLEWLDRLELNVLDGQGPGTSGRKFNLHRDDPESAMLAAARKLYESNIYEGMNPEWIGICLSVLQGGQAVGNNYEADSHIDKRFNIPGAENDAPSLIAIKVMIPELDAHLPTPKELGDHPGHHHSIISMYPTYYSVDPSFQTAPIVGQLVRVSFGNIKTRSDCRYMGPYGGVIIARPPATTAAKCACDTLPPLGPVAPEGTPYQGANIAVNHMGHPKIPRGHGQSAGRWVVFGGTQMGSPPSASPDIFVASYFVSARNSAGMGGGIYMGKLSSNGAKDSIQREAVGRNTFFYFSKHVDSGKPLKVIVYFHGRDGFNSNEFEIVMPALRKLEDNGENFVFIYPEMPYSAPDISDELKAIGHIDPKLRSKYANFNLIINKMWGGLDTPTGTDFDLFGEECKGIIAKMLSKHAGQNKITINGKDVTFIGNIFGYGTKALVDTVEHTSFYSLGNSLYSTSAITNAGYPKIKFVNPSLEELQMIANSQCGATPEGVSMEPAWPFKVLLSVNKEAPSVSPTSHPAPQGDAIMKWWSKFKKETQACSKMFEILPDQVSIAGKNNYWINKAIIGDSVEEAPEEAASPGPMTPGAPNPNSDAKSPEGTPDQTLPDKRVETNDTCADKVEENFEGKPSAIGFKKIPGLWTQIDEYLPKGKKVEDFLKSVKTNKPNSSQTVGDKEGGPFLYDNIARTCAVAVVIEEYWKSILGKDTKLVWTSRFRAQEENSPRNHPIGAAMDFYIKLPEKLPGAFKGKFKTAKPNGILPVWHTYIGIEILIRAGRLPKGGLGMYLNGYRKMQKTVIDGKEISVPEGDLVSPLLSPKAAKKASNLSPGSSGGNVHYDWRFSGDWTLKKPSRWINIDYNDDGTPEGQTSSKNFYRKEELEKKFPTYNSFLFDTNQPIYWEKIMVTEPKNNNYGTRHGNWGEGEIEISAQVPNLNQVLLGEFAKSQKAKSKGKK